MSLAPFRLLVTGAASGIGAALCRRVAAPGVQLLMHTRAREADLQSVAADCRAKGAACAVSLGDLAAPETAARLVAEAVAAFGGIEGLVANAGFADRRLIGELDEAGFKRSVDAILTGFFHLVDAARVQIEAARERPRRGGELLRGACVPARRRAFPGILRGKARPRGLGEVVCGTARADRRHRQLCGARLHPQGAACAHGA